MFDGNVLFFVKVAAVEKYRTIKVATLKLPALMPVAKSDFLLFVVTFKLLAVRV